jgi:hypothetical protein
MQFLFRWFDDLILRWRAYRVWRADHYSTIASLERQLRDEQVARQRDRERFDAEIALRDRNTTTMAKLLKAQDELIDANTAIHIRRATEAQQPARGQ